LGWLQSYSRHHGQPNEHLRCIYKQRQDEAVITASNPKCDISMKPSPRLLTSKESELLHPPSLTRCRHIKSPGKRLRDFLCQLHSNVLFREVVRCFTYTVARASQSNKFHFACLYDTEHRNPTNSDASSDNIWKSDSHSITKKWHQEKCFHPAAAC